MTLGGMNLFHLIRSPFTSILLVMLLVPSSAHSQKVKCPSELTVAALNSLLPDCPGPGCPLIAASYKVDSGRVNSTNFRGGSARKIIPLSSGPGKAFLASSYELNVTSASGRTNAFLSVDRNALVQIAIPLTAQEGGTPVEVCKYTLATNLLAHMSAETGSGASSIGRSAWISGIVDADVIDLQYLSSKGLVFFINYPNS